MCVCVFLVQGEDVVAGIRTPEDLDAMKAQMPQAYEELVENCNILESHYKDMMVPCFCFFNIYCTICFFSHIYLSMASLIICSIKVHLNPDVASIVFYRLQLSIYYCHWP